MQPPKLMYACGHNIRNINTASLLTFIPGKPGIPCGPAGQAAGHYRIRGVKTNSQTLLSPCHCLTQNSTVTTPHNAKHPGNVWPLERVKALTDSPVPSLVAPGGP